MTINADELFAEMQRVLASYSEDVKQAIDDAAKETAKAIMKDLQVSSPKRKKGGGEYRKGWQVKKTGKSGKIGYTVYNKTRYQITHLLEHGHAKRNGGRVAPRLHIEPAQDRYIPDYLSKIERAIEGQ